MSAAERARSVPAARQRRHTLYFLDEIKAFAPVFLDTEVDMGAVRAHGAATVAAGLRERPYSTVSYVLYAAARVLARHPEANAAIRGRRRPRVARHTSVAGKVTLDKTLEGRRVVLSAVLPGLESRGLADIQRQLGHYRHGDPDTMPEFAAVRTLHRLPWPLGPLAYRLGTRPLARRAVTNGTFAVTSLGHRPVNGFYSVGGTTLTFGLGRVAERPVVRDGKLATAPVLPLSMTFDHRVIDGAEAADVLGELKETLEEFAAPPEEGDGAEGERAEDGRTDGVPERAGERVTP